MNLSLVKTSLTAPYKITDDSYRHSSFNNGEVSDAKVKNKLPAMGWNSWNAFGSGNTEALTKAMADCIKELELDKLGYEYLVLDDGCYEPKRTNDRLSNEPVKFPNGFKKLADYIHSKGLKFGMYNDIGTNLCAGANVGTCGYEDLDSLSYIDWDVDFLKVDNCYYLWDNATFSNPENAKYTYAPNIKSITIEGKDFHQTKDATEGTLLGEGAHATERVLGDGSESIKFVTSIGTFDGTNVGVTPVGPRYSELAFEIEAPYDGDYEIAIEYATGKEVGVGSWLQISVDNDSNIGENLIYDDLLPETKDSETFCISLPIAVKLSKGKNTIKLMNHRRQENTLVSYSAMLNGLYMHNRNQKEIILSICEWGKTQPQNWGYKVGNSWRILNDITFNVGSDGDNGKARWASDGTDSITSQYNKCVIMDTFAGLERGWNDPDMLVLGMNGIDETMERTHMTAWCMMNSPLMLGMDLRRIKKGDYLYSIIANKDAIALNQDSLGIQAKRVYSSLIDSDFDTTYITNNDRYDILCKPLVNGDIAISVINLSEHEFNVSFSIRDDININKWIHSIESFDSSILDESDCIKSYNIWTKEESQIMDGIIKIDNLAAHDNYTVRLSLGR